MGRLLSSCVVLWSVVAAVSSSSSVGDAVSGAVPGITGFVTCVIDSQPVECAKEKAGRVLDHWEDGLHVQMASWGEAADQEVAASGRQMSSPNQESPSLAADRVQLALNELVSILQKSIYKSMARKKHHESGGGLDSITITAGGGQDMKKKMKKKKKPINLHVHQKPAEMMEQEMEKEKGAVVAQESALSSGAFVAMVEDVDAELGGVGKTRIKRGDDVVEEGRGLEEDGRGKKKKKKKAILKLLLLGAVLKAKIGLLLQLLSAHLQVKFFAIALAGLAINIARFWLDLKKGHQPQKVIYYEHAQHQHHYEHDQEDAGWAGAWSRSIGAASKASTPQGKKESSIEFVDPPSSHEEHSPYGGWAAARSAARAIESRK